MAQSREQILGFEELQPEGRHRRWISLSQQEAAKIMEVSGHREQFGTRAGFQNITSGIPAASLVGASPC